MSIVGGDDDDDDDDNDDNDDEEDDGDEVVDDIKFCSPESMHVVDDDDGDDGDDEDASAGGVDEIMLRKSKTGEIGSSSLGETFRRGLREKRKKCNTK